MVEIGVLNIQCVMNRISKQRNILFSNGDQ